MNHFVSPIDLFSTVFGLWEQIKALHSDRNTKKGTGSPCPGIES